MDRRAGEPAACRSTGMNIRGRVDYDEIAPTYNMRFGANDLGEIASALLAIARDLKAGSILEAGCGTARWLAALRPLTPRLFGLDLSTGMLTRARQRDSQLFLSQGKAEQLPFPDNSFDLVYCVNALHHFARQPDFIREARRLLRPGGVLAVIGMDPRRGPEKWYIYQYFPGTYETDLARFPSWGTLMDWLVSAGFESIAWRTVVSIRHSFTGRSVLNDPFLQKSATSQLILLDDAAYAAGLARLQGTLAGAEAAGRVIDFPADINIDMLVGK
jgi:SAM-dependent methyltransferase